MLLNMDTSHCSLACLEDEVFCANILCIGNIRARMLALS